MLAVGTCVYGKLGFLTDVGEASAPVWGSFAVMLVRDSDEMSLIIPSCNTDQGV